MANKCDTGKKGLDTLNHNNEARNKVSAKNADDLTRASQNTERLLRRSQIVTYLQDKFDPDTIIDESDFDKAIIDLFGKDDRKTILHKIDMVFDTNEMMRPLLLDIVREHGYTSF